MEQLFAAKAQFDPVPSQKFLQGRRSANPYELIGKSVFINRAAVKMANMDSLMEMQLTTPDDPVRVRVRVWKWTLESAIGHQADGQHFVESARERFCGAVVWCGAPRVQTHPGSVEPS